MISRHETCQQYVARRLSEGWSIVWQKGNHLILSSPDGNILRPVDLRNDVETLRPNAPGDYTELTPNKTTNWQCVDDVTPDDGGTYVHPDTDDIYQRDAYHLSVFGPSGTINSVAIFWRWRTTIYDVGYSKPYLRLNSNETVGSERNLQSSNYYNYNQTLARPGGGNWTIDDLADLQVVIGLKSTAYTIYNRLTQVYVEVDYSPVVAPTVTAQAASSVEDTTATTNGNITAGTDCDKRGVVYNTSPHADPGNVAPGASGYASYAEDTDSFGTGAFTKAISSLPPGTTIYYRMYAHNSAGYDYSNTEISFLTKPAAPTSVQATDGAHTNKVVITWVKSTGATQYQVYRDGTPLGWLGDVATFDDTGAGAPTVIPGDADASDGTSIDHVSLSLSGQSANNGTTHTYKVRARNATGESVDSGTNTGYRGVGSLTYQWQRSAADSDANYSNIDGATTASYDDTGAPADGSGRYYRCLVNAEGA